MYDNRRIFTILWLNGIKNIPLLKIKVCFGQIELEI